MLFKRLLWTIVLICALQSRAFAPVQRRLAARSHALSSTTTRSTESNSTVSNAATQQEWSESQYQQQQVQQPKELSFWAGLMFLWHSSQGTHHHYLYRLMKQHGDNYMIWNKYVVLHDVDAIRDVLETYNLPKTSQVRRGYRSLFPRKGGLIAAPQQRWLRERRLMAPTVSVIHSHVLPKFKQGAQPMLDLLQQAAVHETVLEMDQVFTALTLDTIGLVLLDSSFDMTRDLLMDRNKVHPFAKAINVMTREAIRQMVLPRWFLRRFQPGRAVQDAQNVIDKVLQDCIAQREQQHANNNNTTTGDLMDILLQAEQEGIMTREDVKGQLLLFLFAGHDTTAHTLTWLLYQVSRNTTLQESLYKEAKDVLPNRNDFVEDAAVLQNQLPLLEAVWKETNRLHPAAATGTSRQVGNQPLTVGSNLELPPKSSVSIPLYSLHRNPKYWSQPDKFDPSRWMQEHDSMAFQPFSAGPRNCIGARLATAQALAVVSAVLRRFQIKNTEQVHPPAEFMSLTLRPKHGIHFQFELRQE